MRILVFANSDVGLYKFRKELLERLVLEHDVFVSCPIGMFTNNIKEIGCHYIETNIDRRGTDPISDIKLISKYKKIIKNVKPSVALTYTIKPNVYGGMACQLCKIPYVVNITGLGSALENKGLLQLITTILYKIGIRKAQKVFFQNESNLNFMKDRKLVKNNYDILPGSGVNLSQYKMLDYPEDDVVDFVYVGRMMKEKGFELYLDAAEYISKKYRNVVFHICGSYEDNYKDRVDSLVKEGIINYHGLVDDMVEIYKSIDCTVHPTYYPEGMSNVLLESLACGRPIITTDRPGCKEIVDDGVNGYIVKQNDLNDLIEKVEKFIVLGREEKVTLGKNGRQKVEKEFNRNIVIDKYLEEIKKVNE